MSEFLAFVQLGFHHILDAAALDHVVFLLALAVVYRPGDWREAIATVSAFTVGHSLTLALAVTHLLPLNTRVVEFLIPLTILATAVENVGGCDRRWRPALAGVFGLVHGAGFAGYLESLFVADIAVPLLGFNLGIEAGQLVALAAIAVALVGVDAALRRLPRRPSAAAALRLRVVALSAMVAVFAAGWAVERRPW